MTVAEALRSPSLKRVWPWIWSAVPVILALESLAVAPLGHWMLLFLMAPYIYGGLAAILAIPILPLVALRRSRRSMALAWLIAAVVYLPLLFLGSYLGGRIRMQAFDRLAERSEPLVAAIQQYASDEGRPPGNLNDLVPKHLPAVPRTEMMGYPDYVYLTGADAQRYDNNPWALIVRTPSGFINFDEFLYFPLQNYPAHGHGGVLERVRDWAYVHE